MGTIRKVGRYVEHIIPLLPLADYFIILCILSPKTNL